MERKYVNVVFKGCMERIYGKDVCKCCIAEGCMKRIYGKDVCKCCIERLYEKDLWKGCM